MYGEPSNGTLIAPLFCSNVLTAEARPDSEIVDLFEEERARVSGAVEKRRAEFSAGRKCAHALLRQLDYENMPLLSNEDRSPRWPKGVIGSITHTRGYCAVVASTSNELRDRSKTNETALHFERRVMGVPIGAKL